MSMLLAVRDIVRFMFAYKNKINLNLAGNM